MFEDYMVRLEKSGMAKDELGKHEVRRRSGRRGGLARCDVLDSAADSEFCSTGARVHDRHRKSTAMSSLLRLPRQTLQLKLEDFQRRPARSNSKDDTHQIRGSN
jgi:hypothetical protein